MSASITAERPDTPDASALIAKLEATLAPLYPQESRHGLSVVRLLAAAVPFFELRADGSAAVGASGGTPPLDQATIVHATSAILDNGQTEGTRAAGELAAGFVLLGALCSLLIPNSVAGEEDERRKTRALAPDVSGRCVSALSVGHQVLPGRITQPSQTVETVMWDVLQAHMPHLQDSDVAVRYLSRSETSP